MNCRRYATAHELEQFAYWNEMPRGRRPPRQVDLRYGLRGHAPLEATHIGRADPTERGFRWDWVVVGAFVFLILGVAPWTH